MASYYNNKYESLSEKTRFILGVSLSKFFTSIEAATEKKRRKVKKNFVKLWLHQKRPKGWKDAKTSNNP